CTFSHAKGQLIGSRIEAWSVLIRAKVWPERAQDFSSVAIGDDGLQAIAYLDPGASFLNRYQQQKAIRFVLLSNTPLLKEFHGIIFNRLTLQRGECDNRKLGSGLRL